MADTPGRTAPPVNGGTSPHTFDNFALFLSDRPLAESSATFLPKNPASSSPAPVPSPSPSQHAALPTQPTAEPKPFADEIARLRHNLESKIHVTQTLIKQEDVVRTSLEKNIEENITNHGTWDWIKENLLYTQRHFLASSHAAETIRKEHEVSIQRKDGYSKHLATLQSILNGSPTDPDALSLDNVQRAVDSGDLTKARTLLAGLTTQINSGSLKLPKVAYNEAISRWLQGAGAVHDEVLTMKADLAKELGVDFFQRVSETLAAFRLKKDPRFMAVSAAMALLTPAIEELSAKSIGLDMTQLPDELHNKSWGSKTLKNAVRLVAEVGLGRLAFGQTEAFAETAGTVLTRAGRAKRAMTLLYKAFGFGSLRRGAEIGIERAFGEHKTGIPIFPGLSSHPAALADVESILSEGLTSMLTVGVASKLTAWRDSNPEGFIGMVKAVRNSSSIAEGVRESYKLLRFAGVSLFPLPIAAGQALTRAGLMDHNEALLPVHPASLREPYKEFYNAYRFGHYDECKRLVFENPDLTNYFGPQLEALHARETQTVDPFAPRAGQQQVQLPELPPLPTYDDYQSRGQIWETSKKEVLEAVHATILYWFLGASVAGRK